MKLLCSLSLLFSSVSLFGADLSGEWQTSCINDGDTNLIYNVSFENTDDKNNGTFSWKFFYYSDSECKTLERIRDNPGNYIIGDKVGEGLSLDLVIMEYLIDPKTEAEATKLNTAKYCGLEDWKKDETKNIAGLVCNGKKVYSKGDIYYDLYDVKTEGESKTFLTGASDDEKDGSSSDKRPDKLDHENTYSLIK